MTVNLSFTLRQNKLERLLLLNGFDIALYLRVRRGYTNYYVPSLTHEYQTRLTSFESENALAYFNEKKFYCIGGCHQTEHSLGPEVTKFITAVIYH